MSATTIFVIAIIGAGVLTVLGIFAVAIRRGPSAGPITSEEIDAKAVKRDRDARKAAAVTQSAEPAGESGGVTTLERTDEAPRPSRPANRAGSRPGPGDANPSARTPTASPGASSSTGHSTPCSACSSPSSPSASLWFVWPRLKGGFGTPINAGKVDELKASRSRGYDPSQLHCRGPGVDRPVRGLPASGKLLRRRSVRRRRWRE